MLYTIAWGFFCFVCRCWTFNISKLHRAQSEKGYMSKIWHHNSINWIDAENGKQRQNNNKNGNGERTQAAQPTRAKENENTLLIFVVETHHRRMYGGCLSWVYDTIACAIEHLNRNGQWEQNWNENWTEEKKLDRGYAVPLCRRFVRYVCVFFSSLLFSSLEHARPNDSISSIKEVEWSRKKNTSFEKRAEILEGVDPLHSALFICVRVSKRCAYGWWGSKWTYWWWLIKEYRGFWLIRSLHPFRIWHRRETSIL